MEETLQEQLVQELILEAIVEDQDVSINTADFDDFVAQYVSYYGFEDEEAFFENYGGEDFVKLSFAENIAFQNVMDAAKTTVAGQDAEVSASVWTAGKQDAAGGLRHATDQ